MRSGFAIILAMLPVSGAGASDPFQWLEERHGGKALEWVSQRNAHTEAVLQADPRFAAYRDLLLAAGSGRQSDVDIQVSGGWIHRVVQDVSHPRGVWQRVRYSKYLASREAAWESMLDLDALAEKERRDWFFWNGAWAIQCADADAPACLVSLAEQGSDDTATVREFDLRNRRFAEDGFEIPASRSWMEWLDRDTLIIAPDLGSRSLTPGNGGQPFTVRLWRRGGKLIDAREIWRGNLADTGGARLQRFVDERSRVHLVIRQQHARWSRTHWLVDGEGAPRKLALPPDASLYAVHDGQLVFAIDGDWRTGATVHRGGSLLSAALSQIAQREFPVTVLVERSGRDSDFYPVMATSAGVLTVVYANMRPRLLGFRRADGQWRRRELMASEEDALRPEMTDPESPVALVAREGFVKPVELISVNVATGELTSFEKPRHAPDASAYIVERAEAPSADGVAIPYSIVRRRDVAYDGTAPTLLHAYGGSQGSRWPAYSPECEQLWLRKGGIYVLANIRGGAEFGPAWHSAAIKTKKQVSVDDVIGVARELIRRKVTAPRHLGIDGESNGGMVMGAVLVQQPGLIGAAILEVPDLDLVRHTLLNGSQEHTEEIGSPDVPLERAALSRLSPYGNLTRRDDFPLPLLISSTVDEIVHPAHARKFVAKMASLGMPALYYESATGGHHHNFTPQQWAQFQAYKYVYLARRLVDTPPR